jgi:hypothetical protein
MKHNNYVIVILIALIVSGVGFFAGTKYQQSKVPNFADRGGNRQQMGGGNNNSGNRGRMGGQVMGEILSSDEKSITVKLIDGSSKIVLLGTTTTINKAAEATASDLKVGEKVSVFGSTNTDGSVTAQNIQLNPLKK